MMTNDKCARNHDNRKETQDKLKVLVNETETSIFLFLFVCFFQNILLNQNSMRATSECQ